MKTLAVSAFIVASTLAASIAVLTTPATAIELCSGGSSLTHVVPPASYRGPLLSHFYDNGAPASLVGDQSPSSEPCPVPEEEEPPVTVVVLLEDVIG